MNDKFSFLTNAPISPYLMNEEENEAFMAAIVKSANDAVIGKTKDFKIISWNRGAEKLYGYNAKEVLGKHISIIIPEERKNEPDEFIDNFESGYNLDHYETERIRKDGSKVNISLTISPIKDRKGNIIGFSSVARDITKSVKLKQGMAARLKDKELLLKEVHHRVKNNLQIISSLLNLQSLYIADENVRSYFKETKDRIRTMALIYDRLYLSEDLNSIDMENYFNELINSLFTAYGFENNSIELKLNIQKLNLTVDNIIAIGIIINELVTNSLKYAFRNSKKGKLEVQLFRNDSGENILIVKDNGTGFPPGFDFGISNSFGLQLVSTLAEKINGDIKVDCTDGAEFTITFLG